VPPSLEVGIQVAGADGVSAELLVSIDGEAMPARTAMRGTTDLGRVELGSRVEVRAVNAGPVPMRVSLLTANCFRTSASCEGDGCEVSSEYTVVPELCVN